MWGSANALMCEIQDIIVSNQFGALESGFDLEDIVLDENIFVGVGGFLKLTVTERIV
jgi:hypothetical protein